MSHSPSTPPLSAYVASRVRLFLAILAKRVRSLRNHIQSTHRLRKRYYSLLRQAREQSLSGEFINDSAHLVTQIQHTRELYQRSAQRFLDVFLLSIVIGSLILTIHLVAPASVVTIQCHIYANEVELINVQPTWFIDSKNETPQEIKTDLHIDIYRFDSIIHEQTTVSMRSDHISSLMRLSPYLKDGRVSLEKLTISNSPARLTISTDDNRLGLSLRATDNLTTDILRVKGELIVSPTSDKESGYLTVDTAKYLVDGYHSVKVLFNGKGMDQMNWTFTARKDTSSQADTSLLTFRWQDIPIQQGVNFYKPKSGQVDTAFVSTIQAGWVCILETEDTIRLNPQDFLDFRLLDNYTASLDIQRLNANPRMGRTAQLLTTLTGKISRLETGRDAYHPDRMPTNVEVYAKTKSLIAVVGFIAWLLGILVPIIFRSRL